MAQTKISAKKTHLTDDQRGAILEEYLISELSAKAFCESKSISYATLRNWLRTRDLPPRAPTGFVELAVSGAPPATGTIEVLFPSGVTVRLGGAMMTAAFVRALISGRPC